jgi:hypothetical protein
VKRVTLFEKFTIDWLLARANEGIPCFQQRTPKECVNILLDLKNEGYTTLTPKGETITVS